MEATSSHIPSLSGLFDSHGSHHEPALDNVNMENEDYIVSARMQSINLFPFT